MSAVRFFYWSTAEKSYPNGAQRCVSRSHGVLTIAVKNGNMKGKLNHVDLAGNPDQLDLVVNLSRLKHATNINS